MPTSFSKKDVAPARPAATGEGMRRKDGATPGERADAARAGSGRLRTLTGVQVLGTGSFAPQNVVSNEDLASLGIDAEWIVQRTGIRERRRAPPGVATSDLAHEAARRCLEQAGARAEDVDLIVVGTMTPDTLMPSTACHVQRQLGGVAPAMDVNAACAGFMYALTTAMHFVAGGGSRLALAIGADTMSRTVDPADKKTYPLFGDGAGAVLLGPGSNGQGLLAYTLGADGSGADLLCIPGGGSREPLSAQSIAEGRQFMRMDGRSVFKWAVRLVAESIVEALHHAQLTPAELDLVVLHQANIRILDAAVEDLAIPRHKLAVNLDRYGNTSAGSIPLVLDELNRAGRIHRGDKLLVCGFGAGLCWGTAVMQW
jgi:3-oxoacyl-[acyl-carrier-protein] synthase-3